MTFEDLQAMSKSSAPKTSTKNSVKVGFFKLSNNGDEALVRFDVESIKDLAFASVHQLGAETRWMKIACLSAGGKLQHHCPLCEAAETDKSISKAKNKVYVKMLVAYKDKATGQFSAAQPVIWERPALMDYQGHPQKFLAKITNLLKDFGNLKETVFKITRNGEAKSMETDYDITFIPTYNKPELVGTDFSAFDNFDISRHSYWVKSEEDMQAYLTTGAFPETNKQTSTQSTQHVQTAPVAQPAPVAAQATPTAHAAPAYTEVATPTAVTSTNTQETTVTSDNRFSDFVDF